MIRAFNENEIETDHPIEVIDWTNGEGARFAPAMPGSGAIAGTLDKEMVITCRDREGWIFSDELDALGLTKHKRKT